MRPETMSAARRARSRLHRHGLLNVLRSHNGVAETRIGV